MYILGLFKIKPRRIRFGRCVIYNMGFQENYTKNRMRPVLSHTDPNVVCSDLDECKHV